MILLSSIGIYVRESRDDRGENYDTIETQRDLLLRYAAQNNLGTIYNVYIDDNVSGVYFDRPGLGNLKIDADSGMVDLLLIKDLSRLGRNNARTLLFLEYLQERGVRVLTSDGRFDSSKDWDTVGIDSWYNERYVLDLSRKIRANLRHKIETGEYVGNAPYGYKKSVQLHNRLVIDEAEVPVIEEIYSFYLQGWGYKAVAEVLNDKKIPPPGDARSLSGLWGATAIKRILANRVYIGDTVQGISEKISCKSKKTRMLPESRWTVTPNTHQAIITAEMFEKARVMRTSRQTGAGNYKGGIHVFKEVIFCGECNSSMFARSRNGKMSGYICSNYAKNGSKACSSHFISEKFLVEIIKNDVWNNCNEYLKKDGQNYRSPVQSKITPEQSIEELKKKVEGILRKQQVIYSDKLDDKISADLFGRVNAELEEKLKAMDFTIKRLEGSLGEVKTDEVGDMMRSLMQLTPENKFLREVVVASVNKICVYEGKIEVVYKFH